MARTAKKSTTTESPENPYNPFFITLNGITSLFANALSVGIVILLISAVGTMTSSIMRSDSSNGSDTAKQLYDEITTMTVNEWLVVGAIVLIITLFGMVVSTMLHGIQSYTAMRLSKGEKTTISEAFNAVLSQFGNYFVLYLWMNIKIALWTLLFIVPGVIAYYRYSFAGIVFFDKGLRHEHAIKESRRLSKGGLMTLFASDALFNMITLGYINTVITLASRSELYRNYSHLDAAKQQKPSIHWLSWVTLALPFVFILGLTFFILMIAVGLGAIGSITAP